MSYDELVAWLRAHPYKDPLLQGLADKAVQQAAPARKPPTGG